MKKISLIAALVLVGGSLFANGPGMGPGAGPGAIDWKVGTVVTSEYKKVNGTIGTGQTLWGTATFKAGGVDYQLMLPRLAELSTLKNGDTITIEGVFTTVKADPAVAPSVHAFKVTVNGKEIDLATLTNGRGMMRGDFDGNSGATTGRGMMGGNGRR